MTQAELVEALSPLLDQLELISDKLQMISDITAGVILFLGFIFGAIFVLALLERFR